MSDATDTADRRQDRQRALHELAPGGFLLPHYRTFTAVTNVFSRIYSHRYDEVIRKSRQDALALKRDVYLSALLRERINPLGRWPWEIESDPDEVAAAKGANPKDPYSEDREKVRLGMAAILRRTPRLSRMRRALGMGVWYGRQAVQWRPGRTVIGGQLRTFTADYRPIMGDKILFDFDGTPGIMVQRWGDDVPAGDIRMTDAQLPVLMLNQPHLRERVILHTHDLDDADISEPIMAGRVHGVGLRDMIAWGAELRLEMLAAMMDFLEKVGNLGLLLVYYEEGNAKSEEKAKKTAREASGKSALAVPRPKGQDRQTSGVELIHANMAGVQFMAELMGNTFERHIERAIVGQSMSGGEANGGGLGSAGRAAMATDTKFQLLSSDAEDQEETLTADWLPPVQASNFPGCDFRYLWKYRLPDPTAGDRLDAITKVASLPGRKLTFRASEVRELTGTTKPADGEEIVGGDDVPPGGMPLPGQEQPQPGVQSTGNPTDSDGGADLFSPGEFEQLIGQAGGATVPFQTFRTFIPYAQATQWTTHTLQSGPRKGQTVYRNPQTGETRDTPPEQRGPASAEIPQKGTPAGNDDAELAGHVSAIQAAGPEAVSAAKGAAVKVWQTLVSWHARLLAAKITYEEALPDQKELTNPLTGSTASHAGRDMVAEGTGIPGASFIATKIAPAVIGFAIGRVKKYLAGRKPAAPQGQQQTPYQRVTVNYAAEDWETHTLQSGPREGQTVWRHKVTGETRDDAPADRAGAADPQQTGGGQPADREAVKAEAKAAIVAAIREAIGMPAADAMPPQAGGPTPATIPTVGADSTDEETEADDDDEGDTDPTAEAHEAWREEEPDIEWTGYDPKHQAARAKLQKQIEREHEKDNDEYEEGHRAKQDKHREKTREKEDREREKTREKRDKKREKDREREEAAVEKAFDKSFDKALADFDAEVEEGLAESQAEWRTWGVPEESDEEEDIRDRTKEYEEEWTGERDKLEEKLIDERDAKLQEIADKYDTLEKEHAEADEAEDEEIQTKRDEEDEETREKREEEDEETQAEQERDLEERLAKFDAEAVEKTRRELYAHRRAANPDAHAAYYTAEEHARFGRETTAANYQRDTEIIDLIPAPPES